MSAWARVSNCTGLRYPSVEIERVSRQLTTVDRKLANIIDMIEDQGKTPTLTARLVEREREQTELKARLTRARARLISDRPAPVTLEELQTVLSDLRAALASTQCVEQARSALEQVLLPRGSKLFNEAVELHYTLPIGRVSPLTGTVVVPRRESNPRRLP
jgi:predicted RNase H-like nuclease (RuvC/YqgF family)